MSKLEVIWTHSCKTAKGQAQRCQQVRVWEMSRGRTEAVRLSPAPVEFSKGGSQSLAMHSILFCLNALKNWAGETAHCSACHAKPPQQNKKGVDEVSGDVSALPHILTDTSRTYRCITQLTCYRKL